MTQSGDAETSVGWYRKFLEHLEPGERIGEVLFGLIMVLSFTLGLGLEPFVGRAEVRDYLVAALGCNIAWGIIDAVLYLFAQGSERVRIRRLVGQIQREASPKAALALVRREFDRRIPDFVSPGIRAALDADVLENARQITVKGHRLSVPNLVAALAVFWLVFLSALPAIVPFMLLEDARLALRISNGLLIAMLFIAGFRWASYIGSGRWTTAVSLSLLGVAMVAVALALGG